MVHQISGKTLEVHSAPSTLTTFTASPFQTTAKEYRYGPIMLHLPLFLLQDEIRQVIDFMDIPFWGKIHRKNSISTSQMRLIHYPYICYLKNEYITGSLEGILVVLFRVG